MTLASRIIVKRHGDPSVLEAIKGQLPEPKSNQVRVRVLAAGVGYSDIMAQRGGYPLAPKPPFTPGYDMTGVVEAVGSGVKLIKEGEMVAALKPDLGCYTKHLCIDETLLVPFSDSLDPVEVCCLILNYLTAHCILFRKAETTAGQTVLVHSAAGGVGSALVQLCNLANINVFGTASLGKHELVTALGAIPIDYNSQDFVQVIRSTYPNGIDAAFDPIGGSHLNRSYRVVRQGGNIVSYGFAGDNFGGLMPMIKGIIQLGLLKTIPDRKRVQLCALPAECKKDLAWYRQTLAELIQLLAEKKINPLIGARFPLEDAAEAHKLMESGQLTGKIILENTI